MGTSEQAPAHASSSSSGDPRSEPEAVNPGCGWGRFRPAILAPLAHAWTFIVLYIVFCFTHAFNGSYGVAVLTTFERRFNLSSFLAGIAINISALGYVFSVVIVTFFFAKRVKPSLFAICMLLLASSAFLYMLPHFIYGTGNDAIDAAHAHSQTTFNITAPTKSGSGEGQLCAGSSALGGPVDSESTCNATETQTSGEGVSLIMPAMLMFAIAEIVHGMSGAPMMTIGVAFVDNHTDPEVSARVIGLMYACRLLGPVAAFGLGGYFLTIYANLKETYLTQQHPQWIGAWWLGFLVTTAINLIIFIPISMLPKNLRPIRRSPFSAALPMNKEEKNAENGDGDDDRKKKEEETEKEREVKNEEEERDEEGKKEEEEKKKEYETEMSVVPARTGEEPSSGPNKSAGTSSVDWKEVPKAVRRLITNPVYMLALTSQCIDWSALGYMSFIPKYFEVHFHKTSSVANFMAGLIPAVCAGCASLAGGLVSGKIKGIDGGVAGLCRMNSILSLITLLLLVPAMFLSCPNVPNPGHVVNNRLNLTTDCNVNCGCSSNAFDPVCGSDGLLYFSPCHAGCTRLANSTANPSDSSGRLVRSTECGCVEEAKASDEVGRGSVVFAGDCVNSCMSFIPYVFLLICMYIGNNLYNASQITVFLRCVKEEDKSYALGFQTFCLCFAVFPAPMLYGIVFDSSCILKETESCTNDEGNCLLYDRHALRLGLHALAMAMKSSSTIFYFVTYLVARRRRFLLQNGQNLPKCA